MTNDLVQGSEAKNSEPSFLVIGKILKPHGVRGEVRVAPVTELPERFTWLETIYIGTVNPQEVVVENARFHNEIILLKLAGVDNREAALKLRGQLLQVPESEGIPLEEGEYYLYQLEGLAVFSDQAEPLGRLTQVIETGANNVFVVVGEKGELLIPDTADVIQEIDFDTGRMTVHIIPGLRP